MTALFKTTITECFSHNFMFIESTCTCIHLRGHLYLFILQRRGEIVLLSMKNTCADNCKSSRTVFPQKHILIELKVQSAATVFALVAQMLSGFLQ